MSFFKAKEPKPVRRRRWTVDVDDFGFADFVVTTGDIDGSGETPGVQMEFEHEYMPGRAALAMSAREAELASRALAQAAAEIAPHQRLLTRRSKWRREELEEPSAQPNVPAPPTDKIELTVEEADFLLGQLKKARVASPEAKRIRDALIEKLEVPF